MIAVTGATGHLGRLVIDQLLQKVPASQVAVAVRNPDKAKELAARGVQVRKADYNQPATLESAFQGAEKLLLISSSEGRVAPPKPSAPSLSYGSFTNAAVTGGVVWFRSGAAGSFTVTAGSSDAESGVASYAFPALGSC